MVVAHLTENEMWEEIERLTKPTARRFTVWQCRDECCSGKPYSARWWNVSIAPGNYTSTPSWSDAVNVRGRGRAPWWNPVMGKPCGCTPGENCAWCKRPTLRPDS